jgi:hypothetical protein
MPSRHETGIGRISSYTPAMSILNKLFPETLFPRKLSADAEQRLRLAQARAEEALIRTHVENALLFVDTLATDVGYERALDIYVRELGIPEPLASVVATRALVALGEALEPASHSAEPAPMPELRLDEAAARRRRA